TKTFDRAGDEIERGLIPRDQLAAFVVIGVRQQGRDRDLREFRVAIKFLAVGKGELGAFGLQVDEIGTGRIETGELEALQQRELLQYDRALTPDTRLADGVAAVVVGEGSF